mmetsp:Transcript_17742/g.28720  ORF Transcript_17742/g.28720 Transcript_17742/m.28720 type:complete len:334 (-) Transcript_17742:598-1599(-)
MHVVVIGNGAQGLAAARKLLESRMFTVDVIYDKRGLQPPNALWELPPYKVGPEDVVARWAKATFLEYIYLHANVPECGVTYPVPFYALSRNQIHPNAHAAFLPNYRHGRSVLEDVALQKACGRHVLQTYVDAQVYDSAVLDTRTFLEWERRRIQELGGKFIRAELNGLKDVQKFSPQAALIVNCSGIGSKGLVGDDKIYPIKGQVLHVDNMTHVNVALVDEDTGAYAIPGESLEIGGTSEPGVWDRKVSKTASKEIMAKAKQMIPALETTKELDIDVWSGLRPARKDGIRFELDTSCGVRTLHCYGHGGAGIITAIGAANDIVALAIDLRSKL